MKRHGSRESPARMKRARGRSPNRRSYRDNSPDYGESRYSSRDARRNINQNRHRSPGISPRYASPPVHSRSRRREAEEYYNTLIVKNFSSQLAREDIEFSLTDEFQKFGEVSVRVERDFNGERIAYAVFRSTTDARNCKNAKGHLMMHDRRLQIEAVIENNSERFSPKYRSPQPIVTSPPQRNFSPYNSRQRSPRPRSSRGNRTRDRVPFQERSRERYSPPGRGLPPPIRERSSSNERARGRYYRREPSPEPRSYARPPRTLSRSKSRSLERFKEKSMSSPRSQSNGYSPSPHRDVTPEKSNNKEMEKEDQPLDPNFFPGPAFMDKPIPPEDDPYATRTLFVGNLEPDVTSHDIRKFFENFGRIDDVDVKRAARGQGAYCFVRFANLDQAYKAKISMNGKQVLKNVVRIGYGKVMLSSKVWIGGLGRWTSLKDLEREFDRFGAIKKIDYRRGDTSGSILYETTDAAQAACSQMRGFLMPGAETRLRMDFLDPEPGMPGYDTYLEWGHHENKSHDDRDRRRYRGNRSNFDDRKYRSDRRDSPPRGYKSSPPRSRDRYANKSKASESSNTIANTATTEMQIKHFHAKSCYSLHDLCQCFDPPCWQGGFILKKIAFPVLFFLLDGDMGVFNRTVADPNSPTGRQTMFHFTQRLKLTEDRVGVVSKRMKKIDLTQTCIIVAVPGVPENLNVSGTLTTQMPSQHKPLRGLVKYLKEKEAAGIVSVPLITLDTPKDPDKWDPKDRKMSGMLHAFPPGAFSTEQLLKIGPSLQPQYFADDYLVIVLVKGSKSILV